VIYSYRIEQAIRAAAILHKDQLRKGLVPLPYVSHPYAVAMIVADYTDEEDTIIAALLHDVLEDTDYSVEELKKDFGAVVERMVLDVSEHVGGPSAAKAPWRERKARYVAQLEDALPGSLIVSAADKLHNMRDIIEQYYDRPQHFRREFGGSLTERALANQGVANVLNRRLTNDIIHEFNHVYEEYKKFIANVAEKTENA
jgi:(p)ppGpp synthase/HD superfamily hydrolase